MAQIEEIERRADKLLKEGKNITNPSITRRALKTAFGKCCFFCFNTPEEAEEKYIEAVNLFERIERWEKAGDALQEFAVFQKKNKHDRQAIRFFEEAAMAFYRDHKNKAVVCLEEAIQVGLKIRCFSLVASYHEGIGDLLKNGNEEIIRRAYQHYELAGTYYLRASQPTKSILVLEKVAIRAVQLRNFQNAVQVYEDIARYAFEKELLRDSSVEYLLCAAICHLNSGLPAFLNALKNYADELPEIQNARLYNLLMDMSTNITRKDRDSMRQSFLEISALLRPTDTFRNLFDQLERQVFPVVGDADVKNMAV